MDSSVDLLCFIADFLYLFSDNLHYEKFQDGTVKCIEDEIPFELPEGWCWSRLVSLTAIITKGASPKWQGVDYTSSGIMFITSENVGVETLLLESPKFLPEKINEIQPRSILETHDILTNIVGASIGRTCEYTLVDSANTNQAVAIIRLIAIDMVSYVVKCLNSDYCVNLMFANQVNVARANLSLSSLANFLIPIPPLKEMYRIIAHLDCSLRHISGIQSSEDELRQLILFTKTKILDLAIRGKLVPQDPNDEPASVLLERIRAEKEELIKQGKIKRDKKESVIFKGEDNSYYEKLPNGKVNCIDEQLPFELPDGWKWCNLSMIGTTNIGLTYHPADIDTQGIIVLRSCNIVNDEINLTDLVHVKTSIRENQFVKKDDILICARNGSCSLVGKCALIPEFDEKVSFGAFMAVYRTPCFNYIVHFLRSNFFRSVFDDSNSTAINQLTQDMLKRAVVPLPSLEEQLRIVDKTTELFKRLNCIEESLS